MPAWFDYCAEELPETVIAQIQVPAAYFKDRSIIDMEAQLNSRLKKRFNVYKFDKDLFILPSKEPIKSDDEIKIIFPCYEETPTEMNIGNSCLGISSLCTNESNELVHMKHIDFGIEAPSGDNFKACYDKILEELESIKSSSGWLVNSGNSFHFHGNDVLTHDKWVNYMLILLERAGNSDTTLDTNWPHLQLNRCYSILRVEQSSQKQKPRIIGLVEDDQPSLSFV
jgi:hypothetical protein